MNPFAKRRKELEYLKMLKPTSFDKPIVDENVYFKCTKCENLVPQNEIEELGYICPSCKKYHGLTAKQRIVSIIDSGSFKILNNDLYTKNPLDFDGYEQKIDEIKKKTKLDEAVLTGTCKICGINTAIGVMDTRFFMGSMGTVVGEKITRLVEYATFKKLPLIIFCASGGARMQEGILSLMQMAKTSAAIKKHSKSGLLYISVLTHPTTGGVTASFASLADIILAEPNALIGFAGPRVIEETIKQKLPEGFQRSEYLKQSGFIDQIVKRSELRETIIKLLKLHDYKEGA